MKEGPAAAEGRIEALSMRHFTDLFWLVLFSSAVLVMFVGLPFSWSEWRKELSLVHNARIRVVVTAGVVFVTIQVLMFVALWTPWTSSYLFLRYWLFTDALLLILAVPCSFSWKGNARWWLRACSLLVPAISLLLLLALIAE